MKKELFQQISKIVIFMCIFVLLLYGTSSIVIPKNNNIESGIKYDYARGFYGENKNSLDIIAIGNSNLYSSFIPKQIWNKKGYTSYVCGEPMQSIFQAYSMLKEVYTCQKPKLVILETDGLFTSGDEIEDMLSVKLKEEFPVFEYHSRWKQLSMADFKEKPHYQSTLKNKGFRYNKNIESYNHGINYLKEKKKRNNFLIFNQIYLDMFIDLCRENQTEVLLLSIPSATSWNYEKHNKIDTYAKKNHIPFLDLNTIKGQADINWLEDTRDKGTHLNITGAKKITQYISDYLFKNYSFIDHRKDSLYDEWNKQ